MLHHLLKLLPPETAHNIAIRAMQKRIAAPGLYRDGQRIGLFGVTVNPLGLAAGFDKNGLLVDSIEDYGFGWVEVGSVTYAGGPGNPKPRLKRLPGGDLINRMGLNGDPAHVVAARLKAAASQTTFAVNIAKTHSREIVGDAAIRDVVASYSLLRTFGLYTVLNCSCPNTVEGKTFEEPAALRELLAALYRLRPLARPLLVKLSPTLSLVQRAEILAACEANDVDGYICCNTYRITDDNGNYWGRSGALPHGLAVDMTKFFAAETRKPVIGCGGIFTARDALAFMAAGATAVQAYNGFVRGPLAGPTFAHCIRARMLAANNLLTAVRTGLDS